MKIATMLMALVISGTAFANDHEGHEGTTAPATETPSQEAAPAEKAAEAPAKKEHKKKQKKAKKGAQH